VRGRGKFLKRTGFWRKLQKRTGKWERGKLSKLTSKK